MFNSLVEGANPHLWHYLGRYLQQRRLSINLSIKALADELGLSEREYNEIETGEREISKHQFDLASKKLSLDIVELFEIRQISQAAYANTLIKTFSENYPK